MRDLALRETLAELAGEAGAALRELVRAGEEIPYEVREADSGSPFCHYTPLTGRFIRDHAAVIAGLEGYEPAKSALAEAEVAEPYLHSFGLEVVPSEGRRAEDALLTFLCRIWHGSTDFALDGERLDAAIAEVEQCCEPEAGQVEVIVPLVGLRMPVSRLELGALTIVRADAVDVPAEARDPEGSSRAAWDPQFLAYLRCDGDELASAEAEGGEPAPPTGVAERFRVAISALRLFKPGGVGLGPHGWTRTGSGRWRRIATGAARPRPGGYQLAEGELSDVAAFARALERRPVRVAALVRAISRFEAGLERQASIEALNDYLLALRFLLEGGGPAATGLSMRVAALCAEPGERPAVKDTFDRALALERELWSGDPAPVDDARSPAEIVAEVEDLVRAILKDAACGHLGTDLRATADEILLADGLRTGESDPVQLGETSEWEPGEAIEGDEEDVEVAEGNGEATREDLARTLFAERPPVEEQPVQEPPPVEEQPVEEPPSVDEPDKAGWTPFVPTAEGFDEEISVKESAGSRSNRQDMTERSEPRADDWLAAAGDPDATLEFPARPPALRLLDQRPEERVAIRERVSSLFPAPETTEWSVRELEYDRRRRARV